MNEDYYDVIMVGEFLFSVARGIYIIYHLAMAIVYF